MSNQNLPPGCTDRDTDGPATCEPSDDRIESHVIDHWRAFLDEDAAFHAAEFDGCDDVSDETSYALLTIRVPVYWGDIEQ